MQRIFRAMSLTCALSLAFGNAALALNPQPLPPLKIPLYDGRQASMNKQHQLLIFSKTGKTGMPAAPGTYKLSNGHIVKVGKGGIVDSKSWGEFKSASAKSGLISSARW